MAAKQTKKAPEPETADSLEKLTAQLDDLVKRKSVKKLEEILPDLPPALQEHYKGKINEIRDSRNKKEEIKVNEKLPDPQDILRDYDHLIDKLKKVESLQKAKNKPYRLYFIHRRKVEVLRINFVMSLR